MGFLTAGKGREGFEVEVSEGTDIGRMKYDATGLEKVKHAYSTQDVFDDAGPKRRYAARKDNGIVGSEPSTNYQKQHNINTISPVP